MLVLLQSIEDSKAPEVTSSGSGLVKGLPTDLSKGPSPTSTVLGLTKDLEHSLNMHTATSGSRMVTAKEVRFAIHVLEKGQIMNLVLFLSCAVSCPNTCICTNIYRRYLLRQRKLKKRERMRRQQQRLHRIHRR